MIKPIKALMIPDELVINKIYLVRGQKVMFDFDLAELYGVETRALNQAVKRNASRFPGDFMFQLSKKEWGFLRSQIVISSGESNSSQFVMSSKKHRGSVYLPYVFTEQGVAMLSSVLKSETAIRVNIQIIRVFTRMRAMLLTHKDILLQLEKIEKKLTGHDEDIALVFEYLKKLLNPPQPPRRKIGFKRKEEEG
jgi:hypothetical protein